MVIKAQDINQKPGYKRTEVGVIPEDWEVKELGELTTLLTNGFVGKATDFYTNSDDGVIYIQGFNVEENSYNFTGIKRVTPEFHKKHSKSDLLEGDLLTIQTGEIGLTTIVPKDLEGSNCHALIISRFNKNLDSKYFSYYFNSFKGRARFKEIETGSTMKHLNVGDLRTWLVSFPPTKTEQSVIATVLSDIDALTTSLDRLIAKKRDIKQATMQWLLTGKTRLPGFSEDWEIKVLSEIAEIIDPHPSHRAPAESDNGIPFVGIGDISTDGRINHQTARIVSEMIFEQHNERYKLENGLIGIGRVASIGKVVRLLPNVGKFVVSPTMAIIKPQKIDIDLLFYFLTSKEVKRQFDQVSNGSTRQSVGMNVLRDIQLFLPISLAEQQAIATILTDMDAEIAALEQRRDKTRALKQGMMQELLTGKTRLL